MSAIVLDLQRDALDPSTSVSALLRRALVVARKLGLPDFEAWVQRELKGYDDYKDIPEYREAFGEVRALSPYQGWRPVTFLSPEKYEALSRRKNGQAIAELEALLSDPSMELHVPLPPAARDSVCRGIGYQTEVSLFVSHASVVGAIDAVRNVVLEWSLKLEEAGVLGEGLTFTESERKATQRAFNVVNFFGPVTGSQIHQADGALQVHSTPLDLTELRAFLRSLQAGLEELSLSGNDRAEIEAEIATVEAQSRSPLPKQPIVVTALASIGRILENAAGSAAGQVVFELGRIVASITGRS